MRSPVPCFSSVVIISNINISVPRIPFELVCKVRCRVKKNPRERLSLWFFPLPSWFFNNFSCWSDSLWAQPELSSTRYLHQRSWHPTALVRTEMNEVMKWYPRCVGFVWSWTRLLRFALKSGCLRSATMQAAWSMKRWTFEVSVVCWRRSWALGFCPTPLVCLRLMVSKVLFCFVNWHL